MPIKERIKIQPVVDCGHGDCPIHSGENPPIIGDTSSYNLRVREVYLMFDRISKAFASADSTPPGILAEVRDHVSGNGSAPDRLDWLKVLVRRDPHRIPGL